MTLPVLEARILFEPYLISDQSGHKIFYQPNIKAYLKFDWYLIKPHQSLTTVLELCHSSSSQQSLDVSTDLKEKYSHSLTSCASLQHTLSSLSVRTFHLCHPFSLVDVCHLFLSVPSSSIPVVLLQWRQPIALSVDVFSLPLFVTVPHSRWLGTWGVELSPDWTARRR